MVAKSYQDLPICGEPYEKNKRKYVIVECKNGHRKEVRWYSDAEYAKMYPQDGIVADTLGKKIRTTKDVLGFSKGYITIFKGDTYPVLGWFQREPNCRYHNFWGWYIVSEDELPEIIPAGIEPVRLKWDDVAIVDQDCLKPEAAVRKAVDLLIFEPSASDHQGSIGDRIDRLLTVTKVVANEGYYGPSSFYVFEDEDKNVYTWNTSAKQLELGETYNVRGTIKDLTNYKGVNQTVLTRCKVE